MVDTQSSAELLRSLRRRQGKSLRSAAADIGVAASQLSRMERGQRALTQGMPERLASYYGVPAELIALAQGEIPEDVVRILQRHPKELDRLRTSYGSQEVGG